MGVVIVEIVAWSGKPTGRAATSGANRTVADALRLSDINPEDGERYWALVEEYPVPAGLAEYRAAKASAKSYAKAHGVPAAVARVKAAHKKYDLPAVKARVKVAEVRGEPAQDDPQRESILAQLTQDRRILEEVAPFEAVVAAYEALPEVEVVASVAKVRAQASNRASLIQNGRLKPFAPEGSFRAVSRTEQVITDDEPDGSDVLVVKVFAQYVGENVSPDVDADSVSV